MSDLPDIPSLPDLPFVEPKRKSNSAGKTTAEEQESNIPLGWKPTVAKPLPSVRCTTIKKDGTRCKAWSLNSHHVCLAHGGRLPAVKKAAEDKKQLARLKIVDISDDAVDVIEHLMHYAQQETTRLKAATEILDRAGVKGGVDINVTIENAVSPVDIINQRLNDIAQRLTPVEEAEGIQENTYTSPAELDIIKSEVVDEEQSTEDDLTNE